MLPLFYVFGSLAVIASLMVILATNPVRAVLSLVLTFISMACIWMLLEAEFLSIALVVVYVGAVMVLFLFVVMMIDIESSNVKQNFVKHAPIGFMVAIGFTVLLVYFMGGANFGLTAFPAPTPKPIDYSHIKAIGDLLFTEYLLAFELAGIILLVAMIAAIGLTFRGKRTTKTQKPNLQNQVRKEDRLQVVSLPRSKRN